MRIHGSLSLLFILLFISGNYAQTADRSAARSYASAWIQLNMPASGLGNYQSIVDEYNKTLVHCFDIHPQGFIILSANESLPPVIAYSFDGKCDLDRKGNPLSDMLMNDISNRLLFLKQCPDKYINDNKMAWSGVKPMYNGNRGFQQWPPDGSTSTGGWVETNWKQSYPCNIFCPMDPLTNERSLAGCPSVALAMIIDYQKNLNGTVFGDDDDYFHSYASRQYVIDDDHDSLNFLSFPQINKYFDSIAIKYSGYELLNEEDVAALIWACGVAARQVYTSNGSGTFGVDQAYQAYQRFGYDEAELIYEPDTSLFTRMKHNMINGIPAHYAVLSNTGSGGHNVVVDGYNTENYYHVNFGWGGNYNAWYLLPQELPYNLTITEGAIVDIGVTHVGNDEETLEEEPGIKIYPNPSNGPVSFEINLPDQALVTFIINDQSGKLIDSFQQICPKGSSLVHHHIDQGKGLYYISITAEKKRITKKLILSH